MKNFWSAFFALIILIGLIGGAIFAILKAPAGISAIVTGIIGFAASKLYESWKESKSRLYDRKREVYYNLMKPYEEIVIRTILNKESNEKEIINLNDEQKSQMIKAAFDAILYGSDNVIKACGKFRNNDWQYSGESSLALKELAILYKEMRKDLGNSYTSLDEIDVLLMFMNLSPKERNEYRQLFKK